MAQSFFCRILVISSAVVLSCSKIVWPGKCAARIVKTSSFNTPNRPFISGLGLKTIDELIDKQTEVMVV